MLWCCSIGLLLSSPSSVPCLYYSRRSPSELLSPVEAGVLVAAPYLECVRGGSCPFMFSFDGLHFLQRDREVDPPRTVNFALLFFDSKFE